LSASSQHTFKKAADGLKTTLPEDIACKCDDFVAKHECEEEHMVMLMKYQNDGSWNESRKVLAGVVDEILQIL
jgi:hypothetical protein